MLTPKNLLLSLAISSSSSEVVPQKIQAASDRLLSTIMVDADVCCDSLKAVCGQLPDDVPYSSLYQAMGVEFEKEMTQATKDYNCPTHLSDFKMENIAAGGSFYKCQHICMQNSPLSSFKHLQRYFSHTLKSRSFSEFFLNFKSSDTLDIKDFLLAVDNVLEPMNASFISTRVGIQETFDVHYPIPIFNINKVRNNIRYGFNHVSKMNSTEFDSFAERVGLPSPQALGFNSIASLLKEASTIEVRLFPNSNLGYINENSFDESLREFIFNHVKNSNESVDQVTLDLFADAEADESHPSVIRSENVEDVGSSRSFHGLNSQGLKDANRIHRAKQALKQHGASLRGIPTVVPDEVQKDIDFMKTIFPTRSELEDSENYLKMIKFDFGLKERLYMYKVVPKYRFDDLLLDGDEDRTRIIIHKSLARSAHLASILKPAFGDAQKWKRSFIAAAYIRFASALYTDSTPNNKCHLLGMDLDATSELPEPRDFMYSFLAVRHNFEEAENRQKLVLKMSNEIREAFKTRIDELNWASNDLKVKAKEKADFIKINAGHPNFMKSDSAFDEKIGFILQGLLGFADVVVEAKVILGDDAPMNDEALHLMHILINRRYLEANMQIWSHNDDSENWVFPPNKMNAAYNPQRNDITITHGIINAPFAYVLPETAAPAHRAAALALTYGGLGFSIGHEITHAFDNNGSHYDKNGYLKEWRSEADKAAFDRETNCIINQFQRISNMGPPLASDFKNVMDGKLKLGENIADIGGIWLGYRGLQQQLGADPELAEFAVNGSAYEYHPEEKNIYPTILSSSDPVLLPGITANTARLFYIQAGTKWCSKHNADYYNMLAADVHAGSHGRSMSVFKNGEFSREIFGCEKALLADGSVNPYASQFGGPYYKEQEDIDRYIVDFTQCTVW